MVIEWPTGKTAKTLKEVEEFMIPPDDVKWKFYRVADSVLPDKGYEVLDGELTNESENFSDIDDIQILLKLGGGHN